MLGPVAHIGITVRDMNAALAFYVDVLGMEKLGEATFSGEEASRLTRLPGTILRAVYLRGGKQIKGPPLELLHFVEPATDAAKAYAGVSNPGITEVAFWVDDIEKAYADLRAKGVEFYSPPQLFQFAGYKAKAVYFWGPDGTTLELIQNVRD
ncbi:MAG: VOC family protein [Candidatus Binataceae bacterium]|jgi:catechol 2,3-dioxygenase-like lactoylglutathione lyase family enzyme